MKPRRPFSARMLAAIATALAVASGTATTSSPARAAGDAAHARADARPGNARAIADAAANADVDHDTNADADADADGSANAEWNAFLDRLKRPGAQILHADLPASPLDRAEGQRYLLKRLAAIIDEALDAESGPPVVALYSHKLRKYGMDSADAKYMTVRVDGAGTYRLYGRLGNAHHIAFQLTTSRSGWASFESINRAGLAAAGDGAFEVLISEKKPKDWTKPWLRMDPRSTELILREYFYDWENERPSDFRVERLDAPGPEVPTAPAATRALFDSIAGQFGETVPKWFGPALNDRIHRKNQLGAPSKSRSEGLMDNAYGNGWFALADGEALLIELDRPTAHLWSFELGNFWWESLDYVNHTSSLNGFQAVPSSDGRYRLVVSLEDPGVPNWLDPVGHHEGVIVYRYQLAPPENPVPTARVVRLAELRELLPADTPTVSARARAEELRMRRRHAAVRWAP